MKKSLLLLSTILFSLLSNAQSSVSVSLGVQGGFFKCNELENDVMFNDEHAIGFSATDSKPAWAITVPVYIKDFLRIETSFGGTKVQNNYVEYVDDKVYYGTLSYGKTNYQLTISPAYTFRIKGIRPYIGAEFGRSFPSETKAMGGNIIGGRVGVDAEIIHRLFISGSFSIGTMTKPSLFEGGKTNVSYNRLLLGVNYKLFGATKKKQATSDKK